MSSGKKYLVEVRKLHCCACGKRPPSEAHHVAVGGVGMKGPDSSAIPLCSTCHRFVEDKGHRAAEVALRFSVAMEMAKTLSLICFEKDIQFPGDLIREVFK